MTPYLSIDELIAIRNRLTDRIDEQIDYDGVDQIDAQLQTVPPGQRNDVDQLLGRPEAIPTERPGYILNPVVMLARPETIALIEQTRLIFEAAQPVEY